MRIISLESHDIKRIKAIEITPKEDVIILKGDNAQGKTSVIDSILWALAGGRVIDDKPIREGAETGEIRLDIGDYIVERLFKANGKTELRVTGKDGAEHGQKTLDGLLGSISFDPLEFSRMKPREQYDTLARMMGLEGLELIDAKNKADFDARTNVNRDLEAVKAQGVELKKMVPDKIEEPAVISEIVAQVSEAEALHRRAESMREDVRLLNQDAANRLADARKLREEAELLERESAEFVKKAITIGEEHAALPLMEAEKLSALRDTIKTAEQKNSLIAVHKTNAARLADKRTEYDRLDKKSQELTANIDQRNEDKKKRLASIKMPIDGLELDGGAVLFGGVPFSQASSAQQLQVSMAVAMALKPKLRVLRIKEGGLLDNAAFEFVKEMAKANDFQVWIETVRSDDPGAILIEDGLVHGTPVPERKVRAEEGKPF
jgi:DNA repair exonuclease SbcCD ATPase subunit